MSPNSWYSPSKTVHSKSKIEEEYLPKNILKGKVNHLGIYKEMSIWSTKASKPTLEGNILEVQNLVVSSRHPKYPLKDKSIYKMTLNSRIVEIIKISQDDKQIDALRELSPSCIAHLEKITLTN